jgi:hypothetical protein
MAPESVFIEMAFSSVPRKRRRSISSCHTTYVRHTCAMQSGRNWLLLFYRARRRRGSSLVSLWRQRKKSGATALQSSTDIMPDQPALREPFPWRAPQARNSGGECRETPYDDLRRR